MAKVRRKTMGMIKQLIDQRLDLLEKTNERINKLESFLLENNTEERFSISFRFQGSLDQKAIKPNVGRAKDVRYISFSWDKDKMGSWKLFCEDTEKGIFHKQGLSVAENYYKLSFIERVGVFLERMEQTLFDSNDLVEKGIAKINPYFETN